MDIGINMEATNPNKFSTLEEFKSQFESFENSGADYFDRLEPSQQDYLQDLQNKPSWTDLNMEGKLECVKESLNKIFRGTEFGEYLVHNAPHLAHIAAHTLKHLKI